MGSIAGVFVVKLITNFCIEKSVTMCIEQYSMKVILTWDPLKLITHTHACGFEQVLLVDIKPWATAGIAGVINTREF